MLLAPLAFADWPPLLRIAVGATLLLPVLGAIAYHRALTHRLSIWPMGSVLFAYNGVLLKGDLNFIISAGLGMLFAAAWIAWRDRWPPLTITAGAAAAVALFFCHPTGLLLFAILIGSHELLILRTDPAGIGSFFQRIVPMAAVFAAPAVLYGLVDLHPMPDAAVYLSAGVPLTHYLRPLDIVAAIAIVATLATCLARRWCAMPLRAALAMIVLLMLFVASPIASNGTFDFEAGFLVLAAFILPAAVVPIALPRSAAWTIGVGFLLLFSLRMIVLIAVWHHLAGGSEITTPG